MGSKTRNDGKIWVTDRIGEKVDLNNCPVCEAHPDCFAWIDGHCTALKKNTDTSNCNFYTPADEAIESAKRSYQHLKEIGRRDLIETYLKTLTALGAMDDDIVSVNQYADEMDAFAKENYQKLLEAALAEVEESDEDEECYAEGDVE